MIVEGIDPRIAAWTSYYVIVGSAGAALIGLQFVAVTLIASFRTRTDANLMSTFGTPTVVHLTGALIVAALMSAPWHTLEAAGIAIGLCGAAGVLYSAGVLRRMLAQSAYTPEWEDWLWYAVLPGLSHVALLAAALLLHTAPEPSLFLIAAAALVMLLAGIHNAWDTVAHHMVMRGAASSSAARGDEN